MWDGDDLLFAVEDGGNVHLYRVGRPTATRKPELVVGGDRDGHRLRRRRRRRSPSPPPTPTTLPELFVLRRRRGAQLTDIGERFRRAATIVEPERFTATSADGTEVEAWIMRPAGFEAGKRYPTLLNIHGGPFTQYGNRFFDEFQVQAGAGYAVVYCNPRGSSGYSEAWGRAIRGPTADGRSRHRAGAASTTTT